MANETLSKAKTAKNDEFYTQYHDIEREIEAYLDYDPNVFKGKTVLLPCDDPEWSNFTRFFAQNFERLGLKRLISTSYAVESKKYKNYEPTLFEMDSPIFDADKTRINGKIFELNRDADGSGRIDIDDLEWHYLEGDGDFRSPEVCALRDQADIIITNPPFSLFREFVAWIVSSEKDMLIIGNINAITYREIFSLIRENRIWLGATGFMSDMVFGVPKGTEVDPTCWFTNLDHGRRHQPMQLVSMSDNKRFGKHKDIKEYGYLKYDNYDAIDIGYTDAIPSDYNDAMGVPITFLDKYCPEQFEIVGLFGNFEPEVSKTYPALICGSDVRFMKIPGLTTGPVVNRIAKYKRVIIRKK